jgi:type VI secretion system protein ImpK
MASMYWACAEVLGVASALGASLLPDAGSVRESIGRALGRFTEAAQAAGIPPEDVREAQYALVALLDERLVRFQWQGQAEWRAKPLQFLYFRENTAGDNFFARLAALETQPHRVHVLQVYVMCLALGFQGRYAFAANQGTLAVYERAAMLVANATGEDVVSPHGEPREARSVLARETPIVRLALAFFGAGLFVFVVLKVVLGIQLGHAIGQIGATRGTASVTLSGNR